MFDKIYTSLKILYNIFVKNNYFKQKLSYSMNGEDLQILKFFKNKKNGFYVDVGSFHPLRLNNTFLLHKKRWSGINIDPSEFSIKLFNYLRPNDCNINCLISHKNMKVNFYYKKEHYPLNSTKKKLVKKFVNDELKTKRMNAYTLDKVILGTSFRNQIIDFLDVDVEGAELNVLKGLSFKKYRPRLICVEIHQKNLKKNLVFKFLTRKKYKLIWSKSFSHLFKRV